MKSAITIILAVIGMLYSSSAFAYGHVDQWQSIKEKNIIIAMSEPVKDASGTAEKTTKIETKEQPTSKASTTAESKAIPSQATSKGMTVTQPASAITATTPAKNLNVENTVSSKTTGSAHVSQPVSAQTTTATSAPERREEIWINALEMFPSLQGIIRGKTIRIWGAGEVERKGIDSSESLICIHKEWPPGKDVVNSAYIRDDSSLAALNEAIGIVASREGIEGSSQDIACRMKSSGIGKVFWDVECVAFIPEKKSAPLPAAPMQAGIPEATPEAKKSAPETTVFPPQPTDPREMTVIPAEPENAPAKTTKTTEMAQGKEKAAARELKRRKDEESAISLAIKKRAKEEIAVVTGDSRTAVTPAEHGIRIKEPIKESLSNILSGGKWDWLIILIGSSISFCFFSLGFLCIVMGIRKITEKEG